MFDSDQTPAPPTSNAFEDLMALIKLLGDPKGFQARLDAFIAGSTKLREERADADRAAKARAALLDEREAAIAKREAETSATAEAWAERKADVDSRQERLYRIQANIVEQEKQFKRQILTYAGVTMDERMQDLPSWSQLAADVLGIRDVHYDDDQAATRDHGMGGTEEPENLVAGSTLTRASTGSSAAQRRAQRRAVERHGQ